MISRRYRAVLVATLALVGPVAVTPAPATAGGPISEMIGRYKMSQQLKLPPMQKPFSTKPVKDLTPQSLSSRFKKRFSTMSSGTAITSKNGPYGPNYDQSVTRSSR